MCSDKHYLDIYTKLIDKLDSEIIEEDFTKGIPFCTNIQYDEIVVDEVIRRYKYIKNSNNRLFVLSTVSLFIIMVLLLIILFIL